MQVGRWKQLVQKRGLGGVWGVFIIVSMMVRGYMGQKENKCIEKSGWKLTFGKGGQSFKVNVTVEDI